MEKNLWLKYIVYKYNTIDEKNAIGIYKNPYN